MSKQLLRIAAVIMAIFLALPAAAEEKEPIITLYSDAYNAVGPSNQFTVLFGTYETDTYEIDYGYGREEFVISPATADSSSGLTGSMMSISVSSAGLIRLYGNAENISVIDVEGAHLTKADIKACKNLEVLKFEHNDLTELDLTPFDKLFGIYLTDNPFTPETPLVIGTPKPYLAILEIDIVMNLDPNFNFSDYPALQAVDAYYNRSLTKADFSGCPMLQSLSLEMTDVASLDLSNNPELFHLNIGDTRIPSIDVSCLPKLQRLLADHGSGSINTDVKLSSLDISKNPELTYLRANNNNLTEIDLSNNTMLSSLFIQNNKLTSIDISNNQGLTGLDIRMNDMSFATLPTPAETGCEDYYFYQQNPVKLPKSMKAGGTIDLSHLVLREGTTTSAYVMKQVYNGEDVELDPSLYSYANGKITFPQAMPDSVYVVYTNDVFYLYPMTTVPFRVKSAEDYGQPTKIATFTVRPGHSGEIAFTVGMSGATPENPKTFYMDLGDGTLTEMTTTFALNGEPNVCREISKGSKKMAIYIPEEDVLTQLSLAGTGLSALDLTAATELCQLDLSSCKLTNVDLSYNRCLQSLNVSDNTISTLDLTGIYGDYEKYALRTIDASNNNISKFVNQTARANVQEINLSGNALTDFETTNYDNLLSLDLSNNKISGNLVVAYPENIKSLNLSGNQITGFTPGELTSVETLNLANNCFNFSTLPSEFLGLGDNYIYAPQQVVPIISEGPGINISDQDVEVNGHHTNFLWKRVDGTPLVEGTEFTETNGIFRFLDPSVGKIYCEMTNEAFPALSGKNVLTTTQFTVKSAPTNLVATFTTLKDANDAQIVLGARTTTELFIDWHGEGIEFTPYPVKPTYTDYSEQTTYAGATVGIYTYGDPADVNIFSCYGIPMADADLSRLTGATCLAVGDANLSEETLKLPETSDDLYELTLEGNNFSSLPAASRFPNLVMLSVGRNQLPSVDISAYKKLQLFMAPLCGMSEIKFNNPMLWNLSLVGNEFETIDLTGLPGIEQIALTDNKLSEIDLDPVSSTLHALSLVGNRFTFATLPVQDNYPNLVEYYYGKQAIIEVTPDKDTVDLSSQAEVEGVPSEFYWFDGQPLEDLESGEVQGVVLVEGEDYSLADGVTTFHVSFVGLNKTMAIIYNEVFPNTYMKTNLFNVIAAGVEEISAEQKGCEFVDVFDVNGVRIRTSVKRNEALHGLDRGLYIVEGEKYFVK